jgi:hypothetical protein
MGKIVYLSANILKVDEKWVQYEVTNGRIHCVLTGYHDQIENNFYVQRSINKMIPKKNKHQHHIIVVTLQFI